MKKIKCIVWDLDNTLWNGILLEDECVALKPSVEEIIRELDRRGILLSIASKNEHDPAMNKLKEFGLDEFFLYPQINWNSKAQSIKQIADHINIGLDTIAFIDDLESELQEVSFFYPEVTLINADKYLTVPDMQEMMPEFITQDSMNRRHMYKSDLYRKQSEEGFTGSSEEFLATLNMKLEISRVLPEDLKRAQELTIRTNQLNSTGYTYSYDELVSLVGSDEHIFLICGLKDNFGDYGKIGLALVERKDKKYIIKLLLMSCRVMTKGIGTALLIYLINMAIDDGCQLYAEFLANDRNRVMYITYKLMGFEDDGENMLRYSSGSRRDYPQHITIQLPQD